MKLLITLGHNSSAILVKGNKVLCGYEEERLSHVKSDSSFPALSINQILKYYPEAKLEVTKIFISHWFWSWELAENKYYRPKYLKVNFPNAILESVNYHNTHHDLHAKSLWNFLDGDDKGLTIVADGFGNFGECLSIYLDGRLKHRSYEVQYSLGMMYQYAIRYLGMKENQDEYKLLGYEQQCSVTDKYKLEKLISDTVIKSSNGLLSKSIMKDDMYKELSLTWDYWNSVFKLVDDAKRDRAMIAYFVQQVLERVMLNIVSSYDCKNIKVSGGVFYNVKLNNMLLRYSDKFEANPLAGDQGCAIGFINVRYSSLNWGCRYLEDWSHIDNENEITSNGFTEIFRGNMEFGPRALCNTSTLALPHSSIVKTINSLNGRDTVMPMAPVVTKEFAMSHFRDLHKVGKSKNFMIIAYDFEEEPTDFMGAAHYDSDRDVYTGRLQICPDEFIESLLNEFNGILINTSLNAHGQPILYDYEDYKMMKYIQNNV